METTATLAADATVLYMDGNGRLTCSALKCAGMTAHFSGMKHDLNGARMVRLTPKAACEFETTLGKWPSCENCSAPAKG